MNCDCAGSAATPNLLAQHPAAVGVAALGALLMVAALAWRLRWAPRLLAAAVLYSRLTKRGVAASPARQRIACAIEASPGIGSARLADELAMNAGTLEYHLRVLEREGIVKSLRVGRERSWYAAAARGPDAQEQALRDPTRRRVADVLTRAPGATLSRIAGELALAKSTVHEHLAALERAGVVRREGALRPRYFLATSLRSVAISEAYSASSSTGVSR